LASLATINKEGKPWNRYVFITTDNNLTIRLASFINARKVEQIKANNEVHITCGIINPANMKPYLQIQGKATLNTSKELKDSFWNETLGQIFKGPDDENYGVIEIVPYNIEYCSPQSLKPQILTL